MKIWIAWQQCMKIQITDLSFLPSLTCPIDRAPSHPSPRTPRLAHETFKIPNSAHSFPPYFCRWFLWMVWLYRPDLEHSRAIHHNRNTGRSVHRRTILLVIYSSHFKFGKKNSNTVIITKFFTCYRSSVVACTKVNLLWYHGQWRNYSWMIFFLKFELW